MIKENCTFESTLGSVKANVTYDMDEDITLQFIANQGIHTYLSFLTVEDYRAFCKMLLRFDEHFS